MRSIISATLTLLLWRIVGAEEATKDATGVAKAQGPPPFFLQDPADSLCLAGDEFKRCSIDTLFFVVGAPGMSLDMFIYFQFLFIIIL